ncbi:P-loop containing nucleoside triphosphate hydrolase protein, partial [Ochromonadaceae sp. CCMP2298]
MARIAEHRRRGGVSPALPTGLRPLAQAPSDPNPGAAPAPPLAPTPATVLTPITPAEGTEFNSQQRVAIESICRLCADLRWDNVYNPLSREAVQMHLPMPPFVIFGPPGTGKTSTVIEAILRVCRLHPHKRVLACAPSDAAADVIAERLRHHLSPQQMLRLCWWQRVAASLPLPLRPYTVEVQGAFELPSHAELASFQVVVCSCTTAGVLRCLDAHTAEPLYFDLVVVDEASQAIEAEVLVPLELCRPGAVMVLAGDTHQLGPSTRCPLYP